MRVIGNILWLLLSGIELAIGFAVAGILMIVFIITIPLAVPAFRMAGFCLWPFGRVVVTKLDAGAGSCIGNVLWFVFAGWLLALFHFLLGFLLCLTIIGIPFGVANFKLAGLAVAPYGREVVDLGQIGRYGDAVVIQPLGS